MESRAIRFSHRCGEGGWANFRTGSEELTIDEEIEVTGENEFQIFVNETITVDEKLSVAGGVEDATITTIYGAGDFEAYISNKFVGAIYAPSVDSEVHIGPAHSEVFGAVIAGFVDIDNGEGNRVHFDEALEQKQAVPEETEFISITYLHVTENTIRID